MGFATVWRVPAGHQPSPEPAAVAVEHLTVRYGDLVAVRELSFSAERGAVTALLGPNGAGKTSTLEVLEGYRRPDGGVVRVLGLDPVTQHRRLVPRLGVMLQEGGVYPGIRPLEALRLFAAYYEAPADPETLLARVGLEDRARATWRQLSGGEQQRLSLALALVGRPEVAFLDEPTAGVDVSGRRRIHEIVADLRSEGVGILLTTHDLDEVERLADEVVIVDRGELVAAGSPEELTRGGADELRFSAPPGIDVAALGERLGAPVEEPRPGEYRVEARGDPRLVAALTAWLAERDLPLGDLRADRQRLEDVFVRLTGGEAEGPRPDGRPDQGRTG